MSKSKIFISAFVLSILLTSQALASITDGTIDDTYRYAWGENIGWVDFGSEAGDVHVTDTALSGYAYGENIGWINLDGVINDKEGNLSGYAWGENVGFIDFSQISIDNHGYFLGQAYGENTGWILFNKDQANNVMTDWRPKSSRRSSPSGNATPESLALFEQQQSQRAGETILSPALTPPSTTCSISVTFTRNLKLTSPIMKGEDIKALQTYFNCKGYNSGIVDGIFGSITRQAVIQFQLANNIQGDGIVGIITRSYLK